jgi:hypothetical protein
MPRKCLSAEQVMSNSREAEVLLGDGKTEGEACRGLNVNEQTCYRWRKEYGGMGAAEAHRMREVERENARVK